MKYHFVYITTSISGKYYIGRHTTSKIEDGYKGSGKWVRSIKNKSDLTRTILEYCNTFEELLICEKQYLDKHFGLPECMNFNNRPVGFASGDTNPSKTPEQRLKCSLRWKLNNPNNDKEKIEKRAAKLRGRPAKNKGIPHTPEAKRKISIARTGIKISKEASQRLSELRKKQYALGERKVPSFKGGHHSKESIEQMSINALKRPKLQCPHCNKLADLGNFTRWHGDKCKLKKIPE